jgi:AraC family transcriptional activator of pobA
MTHSQHTASPIKINEYGKMTKDRFQILKISPKLLSEFNANQNTYRFDYHQVIFMTNGTASFNIDAENRDINAPTVLLIAKDRIHSFRPEKYAQGWILLFADEFISTQTSSLFSQFFQLSNIPVNQKHFLKKITSITELIYNCATNKSPNRLLFTRHLLAAFLIALEEMKKQMVLSNTNTNPSKNYELFNAFLSLLEENFKQENVVGFYANKLSISNRKLGNICKEMLGKTTSQIIEERRIIEAKRLLLYSEFNAQQVAYELGFEDHSYFTKVFKRHTKQTPLRYRNQHALKS